MKTIKIRSEKQYNGLWGIPISCYSIDNIPFNNKIKLHSAIIMAISETWKETFKIYSSDENGFIVKIDGVRQIIVQYDNYDVINNTLYEFDNKKEHIIFSRKNKIKQLEKV